MAAITPQKVTESGIADLTFSSAAGGGDTMSHFDTLMVVVNNGSGGPITVTVSEQLASETITDPSYGEVTKVDATLVVAAGDIGIFGPFARRSFRDSSGNINITYSGVTSLTVAGIYL